MRIFVKTPIGETTVLDVVEALDEFTVAELKSIIEERTGFARNDQRLIHRGRLLDEPFPLLSRLDIAEGDWIHLVPRLREVQQRIPSMDRRGRSFTSDFSPARCEKGDARQRMDDSDGSHSFTAEAQGQLCRTTIQIFVKVLSGKNKPFFVKPCFYVEELMAMIQDTEGYPFYDQYLVFLGKNMKIGCSLDECGIHQDQATIHFILPIHRKRRDYEWSNKMRDLAQSRATLRAIKHCDAPASMYPLVLSRAGMNLDFAFTAVREFPELFDDKDTKTWSAS